MPFSPSASTPMDRVYRRIDFEQLKLPLGFVRLVEAVFCLIVFAAFHGWRFVLNIYCPDNKPRNYTFSSLDIDEFVVSRCNGTNTTLFEADFGSGPDFFAYLIPFSLFFTTAAVLFYVFCFSQYTSDDRIPVLDMVVTVLLALSWMLGTMSFSVAARTIEYDTSEANVNKTMQAHEICAGVKKGERCDWETTNVHGTLTIASIAGVALFVLFATNIWFIYKETPFFRDRQARRNMHPHNNLPAMEPYTLE